MTKSNKIYIAIDSNILRTLTYMDNLVYFYKKKNRGVLTDDMVMDDDFNFGNIMGDTVTKDIILNRHKNSLWYLFTLVKQDKIRLYITESVYKENKHIEDCQYFIIKNCFMHAPMTDKEKEERREKAARMVDAYTTPQMIMRRGEMIKTKPPMKKVFSAHFDGYIPTNDCYIMAEATIDNCLLLTDNGKDFIFDIKEEPKFDRETGKQIKTKSRTTGIVDINIANGYYTTSVDGSKIVPKPVGIDLLANVIRERGIERFETPDVYSEDIVYASTRISL